MRIEPKSKKIIREAKEAGRVVTATLKWQKYLVGDPEADSFRMRSGSYRVMYTYEVDGRQYKYRRTMRNIPPETIELYYPEGNPKRAISEGDDILGIQYIVICSIPLIVATILYHLVFKNITFPEIDIMNIVPIAAGSVLAIFCVLVFVFKKFGR